MDRDSTTPVKTMVAEAARLAARVDEEARRSKAWLLVAARRREGERDAIRDEQAETRVHRRLAATFVILPVVRGFVLSRLDRRLEALGGRAASADAAIQDLHRRMEARIAASAEARRLEDRLWRARRAIGELGDPTPAVAADTVRVGGYLRALDGRPWPACIPDALRTSAAALAAIAEWARSRAARIESRKTEEARRDVARVVAPKERIFLPVALGSARLALKLGALSDDSVGRGISRVFVTLGMDLTPFRDMLPLANRAKPTRFEFPPVPYRNPGQNLWGVFDKATWDHVRHSSYDMTGKRCAVCGRRGGWLAEKLFGPEERRQGVECHEVWEWSMPNLASGIGVQRLTRLLVVCPDCHMMFHDGYARHRARDAGLEDKASDLILRRRMLVNRMSEDELGRGLEASRENLKRMQGADKWIMDLSVLGNQQFMTDRIPILREANDAQFPPECIAGLSFESDSGRVFLARSAAEIYADLVGATPDDDWNVVALPIRR